MLPVKGSGNKVHVAVDCNPVLIDNLVICRITLNILLKVIDVNSLIEIR